MEQTECSDDVIARGERWDPLGAAEPDEDANNFDLEDQDYWQSFASYDSEKLRLLEEEQEQLNSSLMALTSHFAQVQFRLKQIVDAEPETKETLLRDLEEFAFRGIPDFQKSFSCVEDGKDSEEDHVTKMESHKVKQQELIEQLKQQLEDLERYAYETGEAGLPQTLIVERQKIIIEIWRTAYRHAAKSSMSMSIDLPSNVIKRDQMKNKLQFNVDDLDKYTVEELRQQVDQAIGQLVNPLKMKEQLVTQLKTQVTDLERFIEFLQGPAEKKCPCECSGTPKPGTASKFSRINHGTRGKISSSPEPLQLNEKREKVVQTLRRMANLMQIYVISQFGCGIGNRFPREMPAKEKSRQLQEGLSRLDEAVGQVMRTSSTKTRKDQTLSWEPDNQVNIVKAVRKGLCSALRDLLIHGFLQPNTSTSLVPFLSCAAPRPSSSSGVSTVPHPWQLFVAFYRTKDGQSVMSNPQRSLAQSFSLEIQGGTSKQGLLMAIGNIIAMHRPYKRGPEAHFKAFLSSALNAKKIVPWLRIILRSPSLLDEFYEPWAHVVQPEFDEIWKILEPLQSVEFQLPEDLSIRSLRNIFDAF